MAICLGLSVAATSSWAQEEAASKDINANSKVKFSKAFPEDITNENFPDLVESFDYPNAEISEIVKAISKLTGKNFILDNNVRGKITIIAPSQITVAEAYKAFLSALAMNGLTVVRSGNFLKIRQARQAQRDSLETYAGNYFPNSDQMITRIIKLKYISADEGKLRQVLINLLSNAIKFTRRGGITMRVEASEISRQQTNAHSSSSVLLHFAVKDTGVGIAPDETDKVFEAFVQTESGQQSRQGTGLGLTISREYVHIMGGDLTVQSEVGVGSVFSFDIRADIVDAADIEPVQPTRYIRGIAPGYPTYRILVAEDDEASRLLLVQLLESTGFEVRGAVNGEEAITLWESWQPHIIFMDMRMPHTDGREATKTIR